MSRSKICSAHSHTAQRACARSEQLVDGLDSGHPKNTMITHFLYPRRPIIVLSLVFILSTIAASAAPVNQQICQNFGAICPAGQCCNQGWCGTGGSFCGAGCQVAGTARGGCWPKEPCFSYRDEFNTSTRIMENKNWDGKATSTEWVSQFDPSYAKLENGQLVLWMRKDSKLNSFNRVQGYGATVHASRWIEYGTVSARIKAGKGLGVVSAFITRSDIGEVPDEIDFEVVGKNITGAYTNIFALDKLDYTKGIIHSLGTDMHTNWHTLTIDWKPDQTRWLVDGNVIRTMKKADTWDAASNAYHYPTQQSQISFGIWDGGQGAEGTAFWAGSPTDWSKDPNPDYQVFVDWVDIQCFYNGNSSSVFVSPSASTQTTATATASTQSAQSAQSTGTFTPLTAIPIVPVATITIDFSAANHLTIPILLLLAVLVL